jgi:hypothetical protein
MLPQLRVASPCTADWDKMVGDDRVRYCDQCKLNVYNFSAMSSSEIEQLLLKSTGRVCGRLYQRSDGTILTKDCPVGFRAKVRDVSRVAGAVLAAMMGAVSASAQSPRQNSSAIEAASGTAGVNLTIVDPIGAIIRKASITVSDLTSARVIRGESDDLGSYETLDLRPGSWKITIYKPGFGQQEVSITLRDREIVQGVVKLQVGGTMMGEVVEFSVLDPEKSSYPMPNSIPSVQTAPDAVSPRSKPSRNPVSRLLRKLHF